jgi:hypothetical protein
MLPMIVEAAQKPIVVISTKANDFCGDLLLERDDTVDALLRIGTSVGSTSTPLFHEVPVLWGCLHLGPSQAPGGK